MTLAVAETTLYTRISSENMTLISRRLFLCAAWTPPSIEQSLQNLSLRLHRFFVFGFSAVCFVHDDERVTRQTFMGISIEVEIEIVIEIEIEIIIENRSWNWSRNPTRNRNRNKFDPDFDQIYLDPLPASRSLQGCMWQSNQRQNSSWTSVHVLLQTVQSLTMPQ